ncbi:Uncharacterised protein [Actinomyces bovis]|uniref:Uncharacterized protein n=1 Tax=Actinomyces bovis TaxID=1658 RepID=A0ABY1VP43_9ACTO|nr:hypothetical protein [Actinomyces bovis]SPT53896.1 Uncharacterised protein [Actinomyces bovis]VEG53338.1 Uncharacterised protein [Actinomyces israelii]
MRKRSISAVLATSLMISGALAACSGTNKKAANESAATPVAAATLDSGAATTPSPSSAPSSGPEEWGLRKPLAEVTGISRLTNWSDNGLTYVASVDPTTKALDVHHLRWDGTEAWKATVTPPQDADATTLTPRISWDDGLGAVAFWYSTDAATEKAALVSSPISWFDTKTGSGGEIVLSSTKTGTIFRNAETVIGGVEVDPADSDGNLVSATYLGTGMSTAHASREELTAGHSGELEIFQKNGVLLSTLNSDSATILLTAGSELGELSMPFRILSQPGQAPLVVSAAPQTVSRLEGTSLKSIEAPECTLAREDGIHAQSSAQAALVGNLVVPSQGTAFCLDDVVQQTDMVPSEYLPDGKILLVSKDPVGAPATAVATPGTTATPSGATPATPASQASLPAPGTATAPTSTASTAQPQAPGQAREHSYAVYDPASKTTTPLGQRIAIGVSADAVTVSAIDEAAGTVSVKVYQATDLDLTKH